jgi:hypothetical protein
MQLGQLCVKEMKIKDSDWAETFAKGDQSADFLLTK